MDLDAYGPEGRSPWLDVDWHEHGRWVPARGGPVWTVELGTGPPIVFVHGHSGAWTNWLEQLPVLAAAGFRCVALDLPGFGRSPMPVHGVSISEYARVVEDVCAALRLDGGVAVVGNSMGGFVGAELAIRSPARVQRLVLVSAAGVAARYLGFPVSVMGVTSEVVLRVAGPLLTVPPRRARRLVRRPGLRRALLWTVATHPERLRPEVVFEAIAGAGKPAAGAAARDIARYDFRDRLGEIACPTLVVWGDADRVVAPSSADVFERLLPDARKVIFADTGHVAMLERPVRFNRLLEDFLLEAPGVDVDAVSVAAS